MNRDSIDQLRAVKEFASEHTDDPACRALSDSVRLKLQSLMQRVRDSVRIAAQAAGLNAVEILKKTTNFQRLAGFQQRTISLGKEAERPIIDRTNQQALEGAEVILTAAREQYGAIVTAAIQAAEKAALSEEDTGSDTDYGEQDDGGDQRQVASA